MSLVPTRRRQHRMAVTRQLADRQRGAASGSRFDSLDWQCLAEAPAWCALQADDRQALALIAGAVSLQPAIRRCLRGSVLSRLAKLIGAAQLQALRIRPYDLADLGTELSSDAGLASQLSTRGNGVLLSMLDAASPASATLALLLTDDAGQIDQHAAAEATPADSAQHGDSDARDALCYTIALQLQRLPAPAPADADSSTAAPALMASTMVESSTSHAPVQQGS